jgi:hypothetical protein
MTKDKRMLLIAIGMGQVKQVDEGTAAKVGATKKRYEKDPSWKGWKFQIRTPEGYKAVKVLPEKAKKK